jgi:hypothetical protein
MCGPKFCSMNIHSKVAEVTVEQANQIAAASTEKTLVNIAGD